MDASVDLIATVEAIYDMGKDESTWLADICVAAGAWHGLGLGTMAWTFSLRPETLGLGDPVIVAGDPSFADLPPLFWRELGAEESLLAYGTGPTSTGQAAFPPGEFVRLCPPGVADFWATLGVSPCGRGVILGSPSARRVSLSRSLQERSDRIAAHLANAYRLRWHLGLAGPSANDGEAVDAILDPGGRLLHAEGAAKGAKAQERLRRAVQSIDRARGSQRRVNPDEALASWEALVSGEWSLIDRFERDGRRFVVALRNPPQVEDPRALNARERQVAAYAALGYSGKETSYALGISPSVVSRHLAAAVSKLGLKSSAEFPAFFARLVLRAGIVGEARVEDE